jgi:2-methylcitrate dehydratase PrpD
LDAPDLLDLTPKIFCLDDPDSDYPARFPGEVIVHLRDGSIRRCRKAASLGSPDVPLRRDAVVAKFLSNASRTIGSQQAEKLAVLVLQLEQEVSLDAILELCVARN